MHIGIKDVSCPTLGCAGASPSVAVLLSAGPGCGSPLSRRLPSARRAASLAACAESPAAAVLLLLPLARWSVASSLVAARLDALLCAAPMPCLTARSACCCAMLLLVCSSLF